MVTGHLFEIAKIAIPVAAATVSRRVTDHDLFELIIFGLHRYRILRFK
jgi:hypothetical protein